MWGGGGADEGLGVITRIKYACTKLQGAGSWIECAWVLCPRAAPLHAPTAGAVQRRRQQQAQPRGPERSRPSSSRRHAPPQQCAARTGSADAAEWGGGQAWRERVEDEKGPGACSSSLPPGNDGVQRRGGNHQLKKQLRRKWKAPLSPHHSLATTYAPYCSCRRRRYRHCGNPPSRTLSPQTPYLTLPSPAHSRCRPGRRRQPPTAPPPPLRVRCVPQHVGVCAGPVRRGKGGGLAHSWATSFW